MQAADQCAALSVVFHQIKLPQRLGWIELPVVADYGSIWRSFIENDMRSRMTRTEDREHVYTAYREAGNVHAKTQYSNARASLCASRAEE